MSTRPHTVDQSAIVIALVASGALGWAHDATPTGLGGWDAMLRVAFAALVPLAVGWAPRWLWFATLAVTGGLAAGVAWMVVAGLGLVLAIAVEVTRSEPGIARVGVGMAVAHGLLHLRPIGPFGTTAGLASLVVAVCAVGALAQGGQGRRAVVTTFGGFLTAFAVLFALVAGLALLEARGDAEAGGTAARAGLDAARDGDTALATERLDAASTALAAADATLRSWWLEPGLLVPVVSQHLRAARAATGPVAELVDASRAAADLADLDRLRLSAGSIDLALVESMGEPLRRVEIAARGASVALRDADSPWLVPRARSLIGDAAGEIEEVLPEAARAAEGVRVLPDLFGANGPRRYLVMFATPAEARELGGILGSYVELTASDGRIAVTGRGSNADLNRAGPGVLTDPAAFPARFVINRPEEFSQNWTGMVDVPSVARAAAELYPTMGGRPIDGIVYVDPVGVAALLELAGPVELPEIGRTIDSTNVVQFLQVDQYRDFDDQAIRKDSLTEIASATFLRLLAADLPGPRQLGAVFGPAARGGHLQVATLDPEPHRLLSSLFLLGALPPPDGADFLSVVHANGEANKLDSCLTRTLDYRVELGDGDAVTASAEVTLSADVPADLPEYVTGTPPDGLPVGTNRVQLSVLTGLQADAVLVDGVPVPVESQVEQGYNRFLVFVDVPPDGSIVVRFELVGILEASKPYRLTLANQARIDPDSVHVVVRRGDDVIGETDLDLVEDTVIEFGQ